MKRIITLIVINLIYSVALSQTNIPPDSFYIKKKFPLDYKIAFARLDSINYIRDLEGYSRFVSPAMRKSQMSISMVEDGIRYEMTPNSIYPTAQLDTGTLIKDPNLLIGKWEMLTFRMIQFKDSINFVSNSYHRKQPVLIEEKSEDIAYATFTQKNYKLYLKNANSEKYSKVEGGKYFIENSRNIFIYKIFKTNAGISQIGMDENGYLIINYPKLVTETNSNDKSHSYITIITQKIFKPVKE